MFGLKPSDIEAIHTCFSRWPSIEQVILYGSRAKGTHREGSDIDLVIESNHFSGNDLTKLSHDLDELNLPYKIDLSLKAQITNPDLLEHIQRVGMIFYSQKKYYLFSAYRFFDQILLGFIAGIIVFIINNKNIFLSISITTNNFLVDSIIAIIILSTVVYAFRLKLWLPNLIETISTIFKWVPIYLAIVIGMITYALLNDYENVCIILGYQLFILIIAVFLCECFSLLKGKYKISEYKYPEAPFEKMKDDELNRKFLVHQLVRHWLAGAPRSGFIIGGYGTGKTSLTLMANTLCRRILKDKVLFIPISSWGHSEGDIIAYIIDGIIERLSLFCDISSLVSFGKNYSIFLSGGDGLLEKVKFMFPLYNKFEHIDKLLGLLGVRVILVIEDMDREFPFQGEIIEWDVSERQKLNQISKLGEDCMMAEHIAVWFTINPNALSMLPSMFSRIAPNRINLNDINIRIENANLITNYMTTTGETV